MTSSDSGSLVIDCLSSNGHPDPPILQRVFWALTEGAAATALLVAGGDKALTALRTVSIAAGLPYTIVLNFMCVALWRAIKIESGELDPNGPAWSVDLISVFCKLKTLIKLGIAVFAPWFYIGRAFGRFNNAVLFPQWSQWQLWCIPGSYFVPWNQHKKDYFTLDGQLISSLQPLGLESESKSEQDSRSMGTWWRIGLQCSCFIQPLLFRWTNKWRRWRTRNTARRTT